MECHPICIDFGNPPHRNVGRKHATVPRGYRVIAHGGLRVGTEKGQFQQSVVASPCNGVDIPCRQTHRHPAIEIGNQEDPCRALPHLENASDKPLLIEHRLIDTDAIPSPGVNNHGADEGTARHADHAGGRDGCNLHSRCVQQRPQPFVLTFERKRRRLPFAQACILFLQAPGFSSKIAQRGHPSSGGFEAGQWSRKKVESRARKIDDGSPRRDHRRSFEPT